MANATIYGRSSTGDYLPIAVDSSGNLVTTGGTASLGAVTVTSGTVNIAGTVTTTGGGTTPVSGTVGVSGTVPVSGTVGVSGTVPVQTTNNGTVSVSNLPATQPISGTVDVSYYFGGTPSKEFTIAASAARTATTSFDFTRPIGAHGLHVWFDVTTISGDTVTLSMLGRDTTTTSKTKTAWSSAGSLTSVTTGYYQIGPAGAAAGSFTASNGISIPINPRITVTHVGNTSVTYAIGGCWID